MVHIMHKVHMGHAVHMVYVADTAMVHVLIPRTCGSVAFSQFTQLSAGEALAALQVSAAILRLCA